MNLSRYSKHLLFNASIGSRALDLQSFSSDICIERISADLACYKAEAMASLGRCKSCLKTLCISIARDPVLAFFMSFSTDLKVTSWSTDASMLLRSEFPICEKIHQKSNF